MSGLLDNHVYRITSKVDHNYSLELNNGDSGDGTQAQIYTTEKFNVGYYNQLWLIIPYQGYHVLQNIRSGTALEIKDEASHNGAKIQGSKLNWTSRQVWYLNKRPDGTYSMLGKLTRTAIDLGDGKTGNPTHVQNWSFDEKTDNQKWWFERVSLTAQEVLDKLIKNPRTRFADFKHMFDPLYLCLPRGLLRKIHEEAEIGKRKYMPALYDCDDFCFAMKAAVAAHGYKEIKVDKVALMCGFAAGHNSTIKHMYNFFYLHELGDLNFFDPETGEWSEHEFEFINDWGYF